MATVEEALTYAQKLEKAGQSADALDVYRKILAAIPGDFALLKRAAELAASLNNRNDAVAFYRRAVALNPDALMTALTLGELIYDGAPDEGVIFLQEYMARPGMLPIGRAFVLHRLIRLTEWRERRKRGLPVHHALSFDEFPFAFTKDAVAKFNEVTAECAATQPNEVATWVMRSYSTLAVGDFAGFNHAMENMERLQPANPEARLRMGVVPPSPRVTLPTVTDIRTGGHSDEHVLFLACDESYFGFFAVPLLRSIAERGPGTQVHIHLMSGRPETLNLISGLDLKVNATLEDPAAFIAARKMNPPFYYGALRFVRFAEALARTDKTLWLMDVDSLARNNPAALFNTPGDAALRIRAGRFEPINQFSACLVMGRPAARPYFRLVADMILNDLDRIWWGLDQFALFSAWHILKTKGQAPSISFLGPDAADVDENSDDSVFWFTAGKGKTNLIKGVSAAPENISLVRYETLFKRYAAS